MKEGLFRKESLDRMRSPEKLDDYICVTGPAMWLLLISVIVLLAGACIWGLYGRIDSTLPSLVRVENGEAVCYVAETDIPSVAVGMTVKVGGAQAKIAGIGEKGDAGYVCALSGLSSLEDGLYEGRIVVKSYRPLSFVIG